MKPGLASHFDVPWSSDYGPDLGFLLVFFSALISGLDIVLVYQPDLLDAPVANISLQ